MVRITVCKGCALKDAKVARELKRLRLAHGKGIEIRKIDCLDACKREPAVQVGKKLLAPAKPKKIRQAVEKRLKAPTD